MFFGSDEMKTLILQAIKDPKYEEKLKNELYNSIRGSTIHKLQTGFAEGAIKPGSRAIDTAGIRYDDYDEIINNVFYEVYTKLNDFIAKVQENGYVEAQRQHWLNIKIYGEVVQYLKDKKDIVLDKPDVITENPPVESGDFVKSVIRVACSSNYKSESKMAFVYNTVVFRELMARSQNGDAGKTAACMNGKQLYKLKNTMVKAVDLVYGAKLTNEHIGSLNKDLGENSPTERGKEICAATSKDVSNWSNRIKTYVFEHRKELYWEV